MEPESVHCVVTSPPYWGLRDYGVPGQLGLEKTPEEFIANMVTVFDEVSRVLRKDGTLWLNMGDSYYGARSFGGAPSGTDGVFARRQKRLGSISGRQFDKHPTLKPKDLVGQPWRLALALQARGWYLRSDIIWEKANPMPESIYDRPTKSHEYVFLMSKSPKYYYDYVAIMETAAIDAHAEGKERGGFEGKTNDLQGRESFRALVESRNKRTVWKLANQPYPGAHFAVFPPALVTPCILAGTSTKNCEKCGAPWKRVVVRTSMVIERSERSHSRGHTRSSGTMKEPATIRTTGWKATCRCKNLGLANALVMDPFSGAGTTGLVATRHGRDYVGIELNPDYATMARKRIKDDAPLFVEDQ
jgi:DNA modification methylase